MAGRETNRFDEVRITLRCLKCPADRTGWSGWRRLRALLKIALRTFSMRCTRLEFDQETTSPPSDQGRESESVDDFLAGGRLGE